MFRRRSNQFTIQNAGGNPLVHRISSTDREYYKNIVFGIVIVLFGVLTGYFLSTNLNRSKTGPSLSGSDTGDKVVGSKDTKTFRDSAEGDLKAGGINGEGTHSLIRPGGDSQTVALTSSVLDLSQFEGKKVRVWGETFAGSTAGWFMDVGKIEVID